MRISLVKNSNVAYMKSLNLVITCWTGLLLSVLVMSGDTEVGNTEVVDADVEVVSTFEVFWDL